MHMYYINIGVTTHLKERIYGKSFRTGDAKWVCACVYVVRVSGI